MPAVTCDVPAYYLALGDLRYRPTLHTEGAWQPGEQHMAPVSGMVLHAVEQWLAQRAGSLDLVICRISYEILGMIPAADGTVTVEVVRPGRTIELLEATLVINDRPVIRARIWRLSRQDTSAVAGGQPAPLPAPETLPEWPGAHQWPGGYIASLDSRVAAGHTAGSGQLWLRSTVDLIAGEQTSALSQFVSLVDTANGMATRVPPGEWMFPNVDLGVHLYRQPAQHPQDRPWVGFDVSVVFGSDGVGLTSTQLFDHQGAVGRAEQLLTVRRLPPHAPR